MVQQLGEAEAAVLTKRAEEVSLLREAVIKIRLQGALFTRSPPRVWEQALCALFN